MRTPSAISLALTVFLGLGLTGCSSGATETSNTGDGAEVSTTQSPEQLDLTGEWEQLNHSDADNESTQTATIVDDTITVYWVTEGEGKSLYWAGTVETPGNTGSDFSWDSKNDTSKTGRALLASSAETKEFAYSGDTISYEVSALGETWTVELEQTSATPAAAPAESEEKSNEFEVTIEDARFAEDYEGTPVIVVDFEFTNNSEETANFMLSVNAQAFQGGVELEGWAIGVEGLDSDMAMADLKPGASVSVQQPFVLRDESTVTVEVAEMFSFDDELIDSQEFSVKQ